MRLGDKVYEHGIGVNSLSVIRVILEKPALDPQASSPYDVRVPDAIRKLKGRPTAVVVNIYGLKPGDSRRHGAGCALTCVNWATLLPRPRSGSLSTTTSIT